MTKKTLIAWDERELPNGKRTATTSDVTRVAKKFCVLLKRTVGEPDLRHIVLINKDYGPGPSAPCASHEFCDANIVMENAFRSLGLKTGFGQPFLNIWGKAWGMARSAGFDPKKIKP